MNQSKQTETSVLKENMRKKGSRYERIACVFLRTQGYRILLCNYRTRTGEIDIIAEQGETLCFVEVKYRKNSAYGFPSEAVGAKKQRRIICAARQYLAAFCCEGKAVRFDVVEIIDKRIRVIQNAFRISL